MNYRFPKVELHIHLDGSVRIDTLANLAGISKEEAFRKSVCMDNCKDLNEYLKCFELPISVMQTRENLELIAHELAQDLKNDNVIYAEVRFFPLAHTQILDGSEVIEAILNGFKRVDIKINLILCMMRHESIETNIEVLSLAKRYLNKGVVAVDLAGAEALYPTHKFQELFTLANTLKIPYTIHAGEAAGKESIKSAIEMGAKRIGHGVRILEDLELVRMVKEKNILLEICPTSNIQTKVVNNIGEHPIFEIYKRGVLISVNTDNRTVSNTTLSQEYMQIDKHYPFDMKDFIKMNIDAIEASFMKPEEKQRFIDFFKR